MEAKSVEGISGFLYVFFWVIPQHLNTIQFSQFRYRGINQKKTYNIQNTVKV